MKNPNFKQKRKAEEFFTKVPNYSIKKCEKLFPLFIDFDLKHCIKTETFKNSIIGRKKSSEKWVAGSTYRQKAAIKKGRTISDPASDSSDSPPAH
ncbi:MAG TPA: hypothetical protein VK568_08195 [Thermodesulfobacteriota bacterium]|nr:hypothetical protein [Thermodesulfobacteriota bacterium]